MKKSTRRLFTTGIATAAVPLALAACSAGAANTGGGGVISNITTVTLAKAQAEAGVIYNALNQSVQVYLSSPTVNAAVATKIQLSMRALNQLVTDFQSFTTSKGAIATATQIVNDVSTIAVILPVDPITKTYIILASTILQAFVAGLSSVPVTTNNTTNTAKLAAGHVVGLGTSAPIVIPAPR